MIGVCCKMYCVLSQLPLYAFVVSHHHNRVESVIIAYGHWQQLPGVILVVAKKESL